MRCPKCGYITFDQLTQCKRCGTSWGPEPSPSALGEREFAAEAKPSVIALELFLEDEFDRVYRRLKQEEERSNRLRCAGFARRAAALVIDLSVVAVLSFLLFYIATVSFSIGLAFHHRQLSAGNLGFFFRLLFFAWIALVTGYFVILHGMEGKTVGKWFLGLRVVGTEDRPVSYGQALVRWIGTLISGVSVLGFLWVLWQRDRRGWHDLLAGTWVIREWARVSRDV